MSRKVHLVVIDPQNDFMDLPKSALPVTGANEDMNRMADFVDKYGHKLEDIHVTMDSHQVVDIAHPAWWRDAKGVQVSPHTLIKSSDIEAGIYTPRDPRQYQRSLDYCKQLEAAGQFLLYIWPEHCMIGTWGYGIQERLMESLTNWQRKEYARVDYVTKGSNPYTEHYGALKAEVPDPKDPGTLLNTGLIQTLQEADDILIGGEASSHCVKTTINQIIDNIGADHVKKIKILIDTTSPVGHYAPGPDFPTMTKAWLADVQKLGVELVTTTTFFA